MIFNAYFGQGSGIGVQLNPSCTGEEYSLFGCKSIDGNNVMNYAHYYTCYYNHYSDIGIRCGNISSKNAAVNYFVINIITVTALPANCSNGDIQLSDGNSELEGRVEVCKGNQWYSLCGDTSWIRDTSGAITVCKQLGFSSINATPYESNSLGSNVPILSNVHCDARASRVFDCSYTETSCGFGIAGVRCQGNQKDLT